MADNNTPRVYKPSENLLSHRAAWRARLAEADKAREALERAVADELTGDLELTNREVAPHLGWSEEQIRLIARKYGVPRRRKRPEDHKIIEKNGQPAQVVVPYDWYKEHGGEGA
ncbi:hypothetical protein [Streptomyces sp. HPF1205]|uniref:hypothetical protein n=1 Tax=Streptomyces sp. HPF1205 TaxID=2873262 RepID=UPI001CEC826F|nr:hypothetical protein [Streptomyces sp. HPF1205]